MEKGMGKNGTVMLPFLGSSSIKQKTQTPLDRGICVLVPVVGLDGLHFCIAKI